MAMIETMKYGKGAPKRRGSKFAHMMAGDMHSMHSMMAGELGAGSMGTKQDKVLTADTPSANRLTPNKGGKLFHAGQGGVNKEDPVHIARETYGSEQMKNQTKRAPKPSKNGAKSMKTVKGRFQRGR